MTKLIDLHEQVAKALSSIIEEGVSVVVGKGENAAVEQVTAPAGYFAAAIALLKHNNIQAASDVNPKLEALKQALENKKLSSIKDSVSLEDLQEFTQRH